MSGRTLYLTFDADGRPTDKEGRRSFTLDWQDAEGRPRGQCFYANPEAHAKQAAEDGHTIVYGEAPWRKDKSIKP